MPRKKIEIPSAASVVTKGTIQSCFQKGGDLVPHYWIIDVTAENQTSVLYTDHDWTLREERIELLADVGFTIANRSILSVQHIFIEGRGLIVPDSFKLKFGNWIRQRSELETVIEVISSDFELMIRCNLKFEGYGFVGYSQAEILAKSRVLFSEVDSTNLEKATVGEIVITEKKQQIRNLLFLCTSNKNRSKTAEVVAKKLFSHMDIFSAGLNVSEVQNAGAQLATEESLSGADIIFVMEVKHRGRINEFTNNKFCGKIINLNIPDEYEFMNPQLVEMLEAKVKYYLGA